MNSSMSERRNLRNVRRFPFQRDTAGSRPFSTASYTVDFLMFRISATSLALRRGESGSSMVFLRRAGVRGGDRCQEEDYLAEGLSVAHNRRHAHSWSTF